MKNSLALNGGPPVRTTPWPNWPIVSPTLPGIIDEVLHSGRWSISGAWTGAETFDSRLSRAAEQFFDVKHAFPIDHGSNALIVAMRALGVAPGSEVIVPGLTWVACASSVARMGAYPVLVDIDSNTQCMNPHEVENAITPNTSAIMVVHLNSCLADLDALKGIASKHGIPLIEDCSQCHGAVWRDMRAGTIGNIGIFSLHQGKLLTAGEGGLVITSDSELASKIERIRADGRRYRTSDLSIGEQHLEEITGIVGNNFALSEFQSAVALDGLSYLEDQNFIRAENANVLDRLLEKIDGLTITHPYPNNSLRAYYHYVVRYDSSKFGGVGLNDICRLLSAELGTWVHPTYRALNDHPLYRPLADPYFTKLLTDRFRLNPGRFALPNCLEESSRSLLFHHSVLLNSEGMNDIAIAFLKIKDVYESEKVS